MKPHELEVELTHAHLLPGLAWIEKRRSDINIWLGRSGWSELAELAGRAVFYKLVGDLRHEWSGSRGGTGLFAFPAAILRRLVWSGLSVLWEAYAGAHHTTPHACLALCTMHACMVLGMGAPTMWPHSARLEDQRIQYTRSPAARVRAWAWAARNAPSLPPSMHAN